MKSPLVAAVIVALTMASCQSVVDDQTADRPADTVPPPGVVLTTSGPPEEYEPVVIPGPLTEDGVTMLVSDYLPAHIVETPFGGDAFCAYDQYGWEQNGPTATAWMWVLCLEYSTDAGDNVVPSGDLWIGSGDSVPLVVSLTETDAGWTVTEHQMPLDGSGYADSIRDLFPAEYAEIALNQQARRDLSAEVEHAARSQLAS